MLGWLAPYGLQEPRQRAKLGANTAERMRVRQEVMRRAEAALEGADQQRFTYERAIASLVADGLEEQEVRFGSIPEESLAFIAKELETRVGGPRALALHVGNFVGVSLAHLTDTLRSVSPGAVVVSVDPGMPHRGIEEPARVALGLLDRFGLTANSIVVSGFSEGKSARDDGLERAEVGEPSLIDATDMAAQMTGDAGCTFVLRNLAAILAGRFDVAVLDGTHEAGYLKTEIADVQQLLRPGGLLVLDDATPGEWQEINDVFEDLASGDAAFERVAYDGRVGILARLS